MFNKKGKEIWKGDEWKNGVVLYSKKNVTPTTSFVNNFVSTFDIFFGSTFFLLLFLYFFYPA